jgi:Kef-type K+ transport system membrane component KefB
MNHLSTLLIQLAVVLVTAHLAGQTFRRFGQPRLIGEMFAGILLGPSVLGLLSPGLSAALFPAGSLDLLGALSNIGVLIFMFLVGLEFDPRLLRGKGKAAVVISHASILMPFLLGTILALYLYPRLSDQNVTFASFALFLGTAMSVTAFPVLAGILVEREMLLSPIGLVVIACAAVDDITAWCILAAVVLLIRASGIGISFWITLGGTLAFAGLMIAIVRPLLERFKHRFRPRPSFAGGALGIVLAMVCVSGFITETLGIHALFGAFLIGVVFPKDRDVSEFIRGKLAGVTQSLFLPVFFAFTGMRTRIGLVSGPEMWFYCGLIVVIAVTGKFGGAALAARSTGLNWPEARVIGILMNTRGLVELVVLNVGLDIGVLSPAMFAMMVIMALFTTFMTTPLLHLAYIRNQHLQQQVQVIKAERAA